MLRMLLVDYDDTNRAQLAQGLRFRGLHVECCSHANHAVAKLEKRAWDVVACSLLAAGDGVSVLQATRSLSPRPISIGYTTHVTSTVLARTAACCDWVLVGPTTATEMVSLLLRPPPGGRRPEPTPEPS